MTEDKKYCPINPDVDQSICCVEGKCAWWDEDAQACALLVIAKQSRKK